MARKTKDLDVKQPLDGSVRTIAAGQPGIVSGPNQTVPPDDIPVLSWQHPVYSQNVARWKENEKRLLGGDLVLDLLRPFEWELPKLHETKSAYWWRQQLAVYPKLPDKLMTMIAGHLMRSAPRPDQGLDFGTLGKVGHAPSAKPTQAELVYFSCNNPGMNGMPWDPWWEQAVKRAGATGHRWILANGAPAVPRNKADERFGKKPFLIELSPVQVPAWYYNMQGQLEFMVIKVHDLDPIMTSGSSATTKTAGESSSILYVRAGCTRLGSWCAAGGWWVFDSNNKKIDDGDLIATDGEIPIFPLFYEETPGTIDKPMISQPATTELGNCAVAIMNLTSAANFDAWRGATGVEWLLGVDLESYNLAMEKQKEGSRWLPLPPNSETDTVPSVSGANAGTVVADVFKAREDGLWRQAQWLGISEVVGSGSTQGGQGTAAGTDAGFSASQMPRIVQVALYLQAAQNMAIYYLERLFGNKNPTGQAVWPTRFNLVELVGRIKDFFEAERLSGLRCTPLDTEAMIQLAVEKGLIADETEKEKYRVAFLKNGDLRDQAMLTKGQPSMEPNGSQNANSTAVDQATRLADQKVTDGGKGTPGRPGGGSAP